MPRPRSPPASPQRLAALIRAEARAAPRREPPRSPPCFALIVPFTLHTARVELRGSRRRRLRLRRAAVGRPLESARRRARPAARGRVRSRFAANAKLHARRSRPRCWRWCCSADGRRRRARCSRCAALAAALVAPWLVKRRSPLGNPFFPFLGDWLGTGYASARSPGAAALPALAPTSPRAARSSASRTYLVSLHFGGNPHGAGLLGPLPLALLPCGDRTPEPSDRAARRLRVRCCSDSSSCSCRRCASRAAAAVPGDRRGGRRRAARRARARRTSRRCAAVLALLGVASTAVGARPRLPAPRRRAARPATRTSARVSRIRIALAKLVARGRGVVAIPTGRRRVDAASGLPAPLGAQRRALLRPVRGRRTPPDVALALLRRRGVRLAGGRRAHAGCWPDRGRPSDGRRLDRDGAGGTAGRDRAAAGATRAGLRARGPAGAAVSGCFGSARAPPRSRAGSRRRASFRS